MATLVVLTPAGLQLDHHAVATTSQYMHMHLAISTTFHHSYRIMALVRWCKLNFDGSVHHDGPVLQNPKSWFSVTVYIQRRVGWFVDSGWENCFACATNKFKGIQGGLYHASKNSSGPGGAMSYCPCRWRLIGSSADLAGAILLSQSNVVGLYLRLTTSHW